MFERHERSKRKMCSCLMEKLKRSQETNMRRSRSTILWHENTTTKSNVETDYSIRLKLVLDSACRRLLGKSRSFGDFIMSRYYPK